MNDQRPVPTRPTSLGIYDRVQTPVISGIEITAAVISILWLVGAAMFFFYAPADPSTDGSAAQRFMFTLLIVFLPVAMIWVAASTVKSSRIMREESQRLQTAIDAMRQTYVAHSQSGALGAEASVARKLDEIAAAARKTETALATFTSARREDTARAPAATSAPATPAEDQPALALEASPAETAPPLDRDDFIRALNFPETAEDEEGFAALRRALRDRNAKQLIQAAQDILTLLSQDGIYMDDLLPDRARVDVWRRFAEGARGREVASLGGIRDRSSLALAAGRMRQDPIFRDTAHHFLRKFDQIFSEFTASATDAQISEATNTRTARAFMLLGRVAGTFD